MSNESLGLNKPIRTGDLMRRDSAKTIRQNISRAILNGRSTTDPVASKLVKDTYTGLATNTTNQNDDVRPYSPDYVSNAVWSTAGAGADAKNLLENLPDLELVIQILVSSIISPNDIMSNELQYSSNDDRLGAMRDQLTEVVRNYFQDEYKLDDELPELIRRALATTGSYPYMVIPENAIDHIINSNSRVTVESLRPHFNSNGNLKSLGLLGTLEDKNADDNFYDNVRSIINLESLGIGNKPARENIQAVKEQTLFKFHVTDNFDVLKLPTLHEKASYDAMQDIYARNGVAVESYSRDRGSLLGNDVGDMSSSAAFKDINKQGNTLYPNRYFHNKGTVAIPTQQLMGRPTVGHPLTMVLPSEAVIPVVKPSDPTDHVGYFVVLDMSGNPLRMPTDSKFFANLEQRFGTQNDMAKYLNDKIRKQTQGNDAYNNPVSFDDAVQVYKEIVEANLNKRLVNGLIGSTAKVAGTADIYQLMLARAYQHMETQLVYVPDRLLTYFAYDYNDFGIGRSILEKSKMIGSLRSSLLYSNVMTGLKNSITRRVIDITLDPKDPAPEKTVEQLMHHAAYATRGETPFGHLDPTDIVTSLQNAGVMTKVKGHPGYPEIDVGVDFQQNNYTQINTELDEMLKKWQHMMFGLSPETVEMSMGPELATSVISHNVFHAKRVKLLQIKTCEQIPKFIQNYTYNSGILKDRLRAVVEENKDKLPKDIVDTFDVDGIVNYFITTIETTLPEPDTAMFEMQIAALDAYDQALEKFLPSFISADLFDPQDVGENVAGRVEQTIKVVKSYFLRRYMRVNNIMPEAFELVDKDDAGDNSLINILKEHKAHAEAIRESVGAYMIESVPESAAADRIIEKNGGNEIQGNAGMSGGFGGDGFGGEFGNNDFGMDNSDLGLGAPGAPYQEPGTDEPDTAPDSVNGLS